MKNIEQEAVSGFLFRPDYSEVLLLEKRTGPNFLHGKYNGPGGKCEPGETPLQTMRREFREECGADVLGWRQFLVYEHESWRIHFFASVCPATVVQTGHEPLHWCRLDRLSELPLVPNLRWMIPLALDNNLPIGRVTTDREVAIESLIPQLTRFADVEVIGEHESGGVILHDKGTEVLANV